MKYDKKGEVYSISYEETSTSILIAGYVLVNKLSKPV